MIISKTDCLLLLTELQDSGENVEQQIKELVSASSVPVDILKYINSKRQLDLTAFYEKLRRSYNDGKSKLYGNIVRINEREPSSIITTLASLNLQIMLFAEKVKDKQMFLKHARAIDLNYVILRYLKEGDLVSCLKLLNIIRIDLLISEMITGKRKERSD